MAEIELLAMSRYVAFIAVMLALLRSMRDAWSSMRYYHLPWRRVLRRQLRNVWLLGIGFYYIRALYIPGYEQPDSTDLILLNTLCAMYFLSTTIPRFRRKDDPVQTLPDPVSARGS